MAASAATWNATRRTLSVTHNRAAIRWPTGRRKTCDFRWARPSPVSVSYAENKSDTDLALTMFVTRCVDEGAEGTGQDQHGDAESRRSMLCVEHESQPCRRAPRS